MVVSTAVLQQTRAGRFRHVVFTTGLGGRRALNVSARDSLSGSQRHEQALCEDEASFVSWLFRQKGLDARCYRNETLRRRLPACLRALRVSSPRAAQQALEADPGLLPTAFNTMVIGVTSFFRDAPVFDYLTAHVIPALYGGGKQVRIWSTGCSDGEELYSIAILLAEMNLLEQTVLLGTDCRSDAIRRARQGEFDKRALKEVPACWIEKYFRKQGGRRRICSTVRDAIQWRRADVIQVQEPDAWDMILCRNMTMYLRAHVAGGVHGRLEALLRPGGFLVLGKAERPIGATRLAGVSPCIYRRKRG